MSIAEKLEHYLSLLSCTSQVLSEASGVSPATISRYCSGAQTPKPTGKSLEKLARGIAELASGKNLEITQERVLKELRESCATQSDQGRLFAENFNIIVSKLNISLTSLSEFSNFDTSYLYRIRSGERRSAIYRYTFCPAAMLSLPKTNTR